jgi:hypothetical protein
MKDLLKSVFWSKINQYLAWAIIATFAFSAFLGAIELNSQASHLTQVSYLQPSRGFVLGASKKGAVAPSITSFLATPSTISNGGSSTLSWQVSGTPTPTFTVSGLGSVSGTSVIVTPEINTTYTLTARNSAGQATATASITVTSPNTLPQISSFTASPTTIYSGQSSTLTWSASGNPAPSFTVKGTSVTSPYVVSPATTTSYTLKASNVVGSNSDTLTLTVTPPPPIINSFYAAPKNINPNASSTLHWNVSRATSLSISPNIGAVTGAASSIQTPALSSTQIYTLTASDSAGTVSTSTTVNVADTVPPTAPTNFIATATSDSEVDLSWSASTDNVGVAGYYVYSCSGVGCIIGANPIATVTSGTAYNNTALTPSLIYYYKVEAFDAAGNISRPASAYTSTEDQPPQDLTASAVSTSQIDLSWANGGKPAEDYYIYRCQGLSCTPATLIASLGSSVTTYQDLGLTQATTYTYAVSAYNWDGNTTALSAPVSAATQGSGGQESFNILQYNSASFDTGNLPGMPTIAFSATSTKPSVGYQDGALVNGKILYYPWQASNGSGGTWIQHILDGVPQGVIVSYNDSNAAAGIFNFNNASNWSWFNLATLPNLGSASATQYTGGVVVGNMVYPVPANKASVVFLAYNASLPLASSTSYQSYVPASGSLGKGAGKGWCEGIYDGRYVYYSPGASNSNIVRYDTQSAFNSPSSWSNFDLSTINPEMEHFQSVVYDGHRYIYYIPFNQTLIVRFDTWDGGTGPNGSAFTNPSSYLSFDPTQLNVSGYPYNPGLPTATGIGNPANLRGFTGAAVTWDATHQNEYLYFVPWATYPNGAQDPNLQSTTARVRIGTLSGSVWSPVDITSSTATGNAAPNWQIFDINTLTTNPAWQASWATTYKYGPGLAPALLLAGS